MVLEPTTPRATPSILRCRSAVRRYPEYQISSLSEAFYRLRLALGKVTGDETLSITCGQFRNYRHIIAIDVEKTAVALGGGASFSGVSTRGGELLTADFKNYGTTTAQAPTQTYVHLHYDALINIRVDGCEILD